MDKLLSNFQLNSDEAKPNTNNLMQKQQESIYKISQLLEQSASSLSCGPACQKIKVGGELKQKYLDAETNLQTAPINYEKSKKNYYVFTEGENYYNNMLEEELHNKSKEIIKLILESFTNEMLNAKTMNNYYNTELINSKNTKELYEEYLVKNQDLQALVKGSRGDIITNDRKTAYETEALENLQKWYRFWLIVFYILILIFVFKIIFKKEMTIVKRVIIVLLFFFYPIYIDRLFRLIYGFFKRILSYLPKNIYNSL
jgi:hypothetical protein